MLRMRHPAIVDGNLMQAWRKRLSWPLLLLLAAFVGPGEAQNRSAADPGKPLVITPFRIQRSPPSHVRQEAVPSHVRKEAAPKHPCLSRQQVHGRHRKYRITDGRQCWYAARPADSHAARKKNPAGSSDRPGPSECQEQALKLDGDERRAFLRECSAGKK
jgi:hypothetical protein